MSKVENEPTAAYILSLIGGIISLLVGLVLFGLGVVVGVVTFGVGLATIGALGLWVTICSIIVIIAAYKLNSEPLEHSKWGAIILAFSLIGAWSILDFIGGILAIVYQPRLVGVQQQSYQQPIRRICPQCGHVIDENVRFCPYCGKQLP